MSNGTAEGYSGDVSASETYERLSADPSAQLVDVRTQAEWNFVGVPDLAPLGREPLFIEWQGFPSGEHNRTFVPALQQALAARGLASDAPLYFLCRSGARSRAAAIAMTAAGHSNCFNIMGGFEGPLDAEQHRGGVDGWKRLGLPWRQA